MNQLRESVDSKLYSAELQASTTVLLRLNAHNRAKKLKYMSNRLIPKLRTTFTLSERFDK